MMYNFVSFRECTLAESEKNVEFSAQQFWVQYLVLYSLVD